MPCLSAAEAGAAPSGLANRFYVWPKELGAPAGVWRRIGVRFLNGSAWQHEQVIEVLQGALGWNAVCGAQFVFGDDACAPVRVTFDAGSSWSQPGTYGRYGPFDRATLNLGWLLPSVAAGERRRIVLHEFGHALALEHEHSHPGVVIPWNRPAVYAYYLRTNGWPPAVVEAQVLAPLAQEIALTGAYDAQSIMGYQIPAEFVTDASWAHAGVATLSAGDVRFVQARLRRVLQRRVLIVA